MRVIRMRKKTGLKLISEESSGFLHSAFNKFWILTLPDRKKTGQLGAIYGLKTSNFDNKTSLANTSEFPS